MTNLCVGNILRCQVRKIANRYVFIVCFENVVEILVGNFKRASLSRLTILLKNKSDIYFIIRFTIILYIFLFSSIIIGEEILYENRSRNFVIVMLLYLCFYLGVYTLFCLFIFVRFAYLRKIPIACIQFMSTSSGNFYGNIACSKNIEQSVK